MLHKRYSKISSYLPPVIIFFVHIIVAVYYKNVAGISIQSGIYPGVSYTWDDFWQTIPLDLLRDNLLESIWYLHAQPPLYNLYGAVFAKLCYPNHLECLHYSNIILGATLAVMVYFILLHLIQNKIVSFLASLIFSFYPSLFLYEAFMIYTLFASYLVTLSVFFLVLFQIKNRHIFLYLFVLCLNLLILSRGLYHPAILLIAIPLLVFLATPNPDTSNRTGSDAGASESSPGDSERFDVVPMQSIGPTQSIGSRKNQWVKVLVISLLISLLSLGWYGKNYVQYGFFGSSSWAGLNLWRIATHDYGESELKELAQGSILDEMVVNVEVFSPLENYADYGFNQTSDIALLSQPNLDNINVVGISNQYLTNALILIRLDPWRYLIGVKDAYRVYSCHSSARHFFVKENASKILAHVALSESVTGFWLGDEPVFTMSVCSLFYLLLPASLLVYALLFIKKCGPKPQKSWGTCIRTDAVMLYIVFIIIYTTLISSLFEIGENERFKFLIEPVFWIFLVVLAWRILQIFFKVFYRPV